MNIEVECKVRIEESEINSFLDKITAYMMGHTPTQIVKEDTYYSYANKKATLFRLRKLGNNVIITRKVKERRDDGVEVNKEIEFTSPSNTSITHFFESLGYTPVMRKKKEGYSWIKQHLTIELVEVAPLGWFLEIEVLAIDNEVEKKRAISELSDVRKALEIDSFELVPDYYNDLLKKIRS